MQDEWTGSLADKRWIEDVIKIYDRNHPMDLDSIAMSVVSAKQEQNELQRSNLVSKTGVIKGNEAGRRMGISIPEELLMIIRRRYKNIIRDPQQYQWFKKNFPMFVVNR